MSEQRSVDPEPSGRGREQHQAAQRAKLPAVELDARREQRRDQDEENAVGAGVYLLDDRAAFGGVADESVEKIGAEHKAQQDERRKQREQIDELGAALPLPFDRYVSICHLHRRVAPASGHASLSAKLPSACAPAI